MNSEDQKLVGGPNDITVIATDRSGNEGKATATPTVDTQPFDPNSHSDRASRRVTG